MFNWLRNLLRSKKNKPNEYDIGSKPNLDQDSPTSPAINQRIVASSKTRSGKAPVIVRGKSWVNTAEDRWALPDIQTSIDASNIDSLIQNLKRVERVEVRYSAAESLEQLGQNAAPAIPDLLISAIDPNEDVRKASLKALNAIDSRWSNNADIQPSIPHLVEALEYHTSKDVLNSAIDLLQIIGSPSIPCLSESLLNGEDTVNKIHILRIISRMKPSDESSISGIKKVLGSQHLQVRIAAANTLAKIGPTEDTIPALVAGLSDSFPNGRIAMASCLGQIGAKAEPAIPSLLPLLIDRKNDVRDVATETIAKIGPGAVPAMIEIVKTRDAARLKAWFQAKNKVSRWFQEPQHDIIVTDYYKLFANLNWAALDILEEQACLELAQEAALGVLGQIGSEAVDSVPVIIEALQDSNPMIRAAAAQALGLIGPFDESTLESSISGLINTLVDKNKSVRKASIEAINNYNADQISSTPVINAIMRISGHLENPSDFVIDAFVSIGAPSIPVLEDVLKSGNRVAKQNAARAIGLIGPDAEYAIPMLTQALPGNHPWVQAEINNAIAKIQENTA